MTGSQPRGYDPDRGQSNVLGYVILFAVILTAMTVVTTDGLGTVSSLRESSRVDSAQHGMDVLSRNTQEVYTSRAPARSTELQLNGGQLAMTGETTLTVNVTGGGVAYNYSRASTRLTHDVADSQVSLVLGAEFRTDPSGAVSMQGRPPFVLRDDRVLVTAVLQRGTGAIGGTTTVNVLTLSRDVHLVNHTSVEPVDDPLRVELKIETTPARAAAWRTYFREQGLNPVDSDPADGDIRYAIETRRVAIRQAVLEFRLRV